MPDSKIARQTIEHSFFFSFQSPTRILHLFLFMKTDEEFVFLIGWKAHIKEILPGTLLPAISCTKNNFYIPTLKKYNNNSPGGGKLRLASNVSPQRNPGPALHILMVWRQLCFLAEAELIQLHWKRHGLAFFFCVLNTQSLPFS